MKNLIMLLMVLVFLSCSHAPQVVNEYEEEDLKTLIEFADSQDVIAAKTKRGK